MSKLYWNLRRSIPSNKYVKTYIYTDQKEPNLYPSNRWGYGYYINKHKRQQKNERSPLLQQWYANLESKTK